MFKITTLDCDLKMDTLMYLFSTLGIANVSIFIEQR